MKYNRLGKTKLTVSELGLGTAQIGGPSIIKGMPLGAKPISDKDAYEILSLAHEAGINFYDSSDKYGDGLAERRLGDYFKGSRDIVIATKCGLDENGERRFDRQYIIKTVEGSLRRLRKEQIDLFQFSKPTLSNIQNDDLIETVLLLKKQGKIAYAGISVGNIEDGFGFLEQEVWDSFQIIYNLLTLDFNVLISHIFKMNKGIIIRSPLSSGMLTGNINESTKFSDSDDRSIFMKGRLFQIRCNMVKTIIEKYELTNDELNLFSLNFLLSDPQVTTIIPGATSPAQIKNNIKVLNMQRFSSDQWNDIFKLCQDLALRNPLNITY